MPEIRFTYQAPTAGEHEVGIAGDFTSWEILDLIDIGGIYILSLYVENGRYLYKFIVDGEWQTDPNNILQEPDPFGGYNSVLIMRSETIHQITWEEVSNDLRLLQERIGHYMQLNRVSPNEYELRFIWYPGLPAEITATIDEIDYPMFRVGASANKAVYHCRFNTQSHTAAVLITISNALHKLYFGSDGFSTLAHHCEPIKMELDDLAVFAIPDWVHKGIIYQIFPDRFCNGDKALNPDIGEWYYADCKTQPPAGTVLPKNMEYYHLVEDWNDFSGLTQSPWMDKGKPDWWSFYGGDIPGVLQKLDYLQELGITIIYFNPLWQAKSNHKYDAADFCKIDPHFGTTEDMQNLVREAHNRGIRIIVDVAFNHTGESFWAFRDCVEKGSSSEYWNWYDWKKWPLPKPLPADFYPKDYYQCWWGNKDMPDLNFDLDRTHPSENYIKDITKASPNQVLVEHILNCVEWWLREVDIDGFRLDVPDEVPFWFWELFRKRVKSIKPDAWLVGEIWQSAQGWVNSRYFDSVMNYAYFKNPVLEYFILRLIDTKSFCAHIDEGLAQYPFHAVQAMMNLLGSHDTVRILELAKGNISRLKLALLFQMTFIGTPHIYYGDEIAMLGKKDPDNRRPFDWNWENDSQSRDLRTYLISLIALRKANPVFQDGEFEFLPASGSLLAYRRYHANSCYCVVMNTSSIIQTHPLTGPVKTGFILGDIKEQPDSLVLHPGSACVYFCS